MITFMPVMMRIDGTHWSTKSTSKNTQRSEENKTFHAPGLTPKTSGISMSRFFDIYIETYPDDTRKGVPTNRPIKACLLHRKHCKFQKNQ